MTATARFQRLLGPRSVGRRIARCLAVSAGSTVLSAAVLVALVLGAEVRPGVANVVAVCCGIPFSYAANRRFAWHRQGRGSLAREVVPFWVLSLAGLVASTVVVARVGAWSARWAPSIRAVALPAAEGGTFALLWVVQFVVLDRVIFRARPAPEEAEPSRPDVAPPLAA